MKKMAEDEFGRLSGIVFLAGPPGAGKSSVAHALFRRHPRAMHADVDALRALVRSGFADPTLPWSAETRAQFRLARRAARAIADLYVAERYLVIVDDMVVPRNPDMRIWSGLGDAMLARVVLLPRTRVAVERNRTRKRGKVTQRLASLIPRIRKEFAEEPRPRVWSYVDNSALTVE